MALLIASSHMNISSRNVHFILVDNTMITTQVQGISFLTPFHNFRREDKSMYERQEKEKVSLCVC